MVERDCTMEPCLVLLTLYASRLLLLPCTCPAVPYLKVFALLLLLGILFLTIMLPKSSQA